VKAATKLHLRCFDAPCDGWYNTDVSPHILVARIPFLPRILRRLSLLGDKRFRQHAEGLFAEVHFLDATKQFPFSSNTLEAVYSSHMLVNFTQGQALRCLKEIHRVLRTGGIVRLAMPDLDRWVESYDPVRPETFLHLIYQPETKGKKNRIRWMYNAHSMRKALEAAGFHDVTEYPMFEGKCPDVKGIDHRSDSFFIEATK
jgi:predicted SAM-dependent methyltransferase